MTCDKCRTKAMKIAAKTSGVNSVAIEGSDKDQLVVIGEGVDTPNLTRSLRKKLCYAEILKVEEVKPKEEEKKPKEEEKKPKEEEKKPPLCPTLSLCHQYPPFPMYCEPMYCEPLRCASSSDGGCFIM
ncbi:heavy metal-associated isoprenylated plant protein 47-like isoform X2 [Alnus glutinosa]|nr:heavy metal-associated isoprenylated plant protein 47-like isoform X2 [Alnus glutinosa]